MCACVPKYIYEYTLYIYFSQISTFSLIAICRSADESPELKLFTKLKTINNAQREYLDNTRNQGDLVASASDRSKKITIFVHMYILSTFIHMILCTITIIIIIYLSMLLLLFMNYGLIFVCE